MLVENKNKTKDIADLCADIVSNMQIGLHVYHLEDINDDSTLRMITANFASSKLTGTPVEDVVGKTIDDNFPGLREKGIPQAYAKVVKTQTAIVLEDVYYGDDRVVNGAFSVKAFPLPNDCVGVTFENITEKKIAAEMHERHSAFGLNNPAPLLQIDYNGIIISANPTSNNLFSGKLIGKAAGNILSGLDENTISKLSTEKPLQFEDKIKEKTYLFTIKKHDNTRSIFIYGSDITDLKKSEIRLEKKTHDLSERIKELKCLYEFSKITAEPDQSLDEIFKRTVGLIPPSWQYPEITCARITYNGEEYSTPNWQMTNWKQHSDIYVKGEISGIIEVAYLEERPEVDEGPFSKEERTLINALGKLLSDYIEGKQVQEDLYKSEERFKTIADSVLDAIIMIDNDAKISFWNKAAEKIFGYSNNESIGEDIHKLLAPMKYKEMIEKNFSKFKSSGAGNAIGQTTRLSAVKKDGSEVPIELSISGLKIEDKWQAVGIVRDITDQVEAEANQDRITSQLLQSDKMAAIGTLAAGVAHEINNPIGFINSNLNTMSKYLKKIKTIMSEELEDKPETIEDLSEMMEDFDDAIDESLEGTNRVKCIVADLKSFSRVDKAKEEPADINEGIETTLNIVWNELKYKCEVKKDLGELPHIVCMPNQINQVFMNVLINAGQAIGKKGIILIKTWSDEEQVHISIKDSGCGIPEDKINKIFEPFYTTKEVGKGTGLGLSLVFDIVKKHSGSVKINSEVGVGTEFIISLPIGEQKDE